MAERKNEADRDLRKSCIVSAGKSGARRERRERDPAAWVRDGIGSFFKRHPGARSEGIIVAYSGGADSTVLLSALAALKPCAIRAVHVSHGLRPADELRTERALVERTCRGLGVPLTVATIRPGSVERLAKDKAIGIEAAARLLRYHSLEAAARRFGMKTICTAHTADDQLETLLARFIASSSAEGLAGIPELRPIGRGRFLARPLIFASREDIERYAEAEGLSFSTDSTNAEDRYARNRIRHALVPRLDSEFPGWRRGALGSAEKLKADRDALRLYLKRALAECGFAEGPRGAAFNLAGFLSLPEALKARILARAAAAAGIKGRLPYRALRSASLAVSNGAKAVDLAGARLRTLGERVEILPILDFHREDKYFFQILSEGLFQCGPISLEARWEPESSPDATAPIRGASEPAGSLFEGSFSFPLQVRSRMPGDAIFCSGAPRRLDGLLSSWRLDPRDKDLIPVVEDRRGIVAVLAGALDRPLRGKDALRRDKFRDYGGDESGRRLFIRIKGA